MRSNDRKILLGKLGKPHGVKGFLYFHYYGEDKLVLQTYSAMHLEDEETLHLEKTFEKSDRLIVKFKGHNDRNAAEKLRDKEVFIFEEDLPELEEGEFYLYQLEGLLVKNLQNIILGKIKGSAGTKSNEVLVIQGSSESIDNQDRLIPYVKPEVVKEISLIKQLVIVDWPEDF